MNQRIFVTGTDTDVGKTVVSGLLAKVWRAHYWKPIQAGTQPRTDSQTVAEWIGYERVFPERHRLAHPASPNQSAKREGRSLCLGDFQLPDGDGPLVVEGAGGALVPINDRHFMIDLMVQLGLPVVVVARSGLGTLNHSFLTLEALRQRGLAILGLVTVGESHTENFEDLQKFGQVPLLGHVPWLENLDPAAFEAIYRKGFQTRLLDQTP